MHEENTSWKCWGTVSWLLEVVIKSWTVNRYARGVAVLNYSMPTFVDEPLTISSNEKHISSWFSYNSEANSKIVKRKFLRNAFDTTCIVIYVANSNHQSHNSVSILSKRVIVSKNNDVSFFCWREYIFVTLNTRQYIYTLYLNLL